MKKKENKIDFKLEEKTFKGDKKEKFKTSTPAQKRNPQYKKLNLTDALF